MGTATPSVLGRHVHPAAKPEIPTPPHTPTGIDYLGLVEQRLAAEGRQRISYALLAGDRQPDGGSDHPGSQAELPGSNTTADPHRDRSGGHANGEGTSTIPPADAASTNQTATSNDKESR